MTATIGLREVVRQGKSASVGYTLDFQSVGFLNLLVRRIALLGVHTKVLLWMLSGGKIAGLQIPFQFALD
jgi:hypothetical protein